MTSNPARDEWFVDGTQMRTIALTASALTASPAREAAADPQVARIGSPTDGTIFALDPDIPPARPRVWFERAGSGTLTWRLDGKRYGRDARAAWLPWPGCHRLERVDVRGAFAKTSVKSAR